MTTLHQCDITGKMYEDEDKLERVYVGPVSWDWFEVGPDASEEEIADEIRKRAEPAAEVAADLTGDVDD